MKNYVKFVNKHNLQIARKNIGLQTKESSDLISKSKKDLVLEWENGISLPTWEQLTKLGKVYNVPELIFTSKQLIEETKKIPDYRLGAKEESDKDVKKLINIVIKRQTWLENKLKYDGASKNTIIGVGRNISNPLELSKKILSELDINFETIKKIAGSDSNKRTLKYIIGQAEKKGIFVGKTMSHHKIDVDSMRGLFISNDYAPYIILNRKDAVSAQIFSFIHELAHLFRKSEGISNSLDFRISNSKVDQEETFCNRVAAELLLPETEFTQKYYSEEQISELAYTYKLSKIFIFYRLKDLGKIEKQNIEEIESNIKKETSKNIILKQNQAKITGGNYNTSMQDSNGELFNKMVSSLYLKNKIDYVEASNLLKFSVEKYER